MQVLYFIFKGPRRGVLRVRLVRKLLECLELLAEGISLRGIPDRAEPLRAARETRLVVARRHLFYVTRSVE